MNVLWHSEQEPPGRVRNEEKLAWWSAMMLMKWAKVQYSTRQKLDVGGWTWCRAAATSLPASIMIERILSCERKGGMCRRQAGGARTKREK